MSGVRKITSAAVQMASCARPLGRPATLPAVLTEESSDGSEDIYKQAYLEGFTAGEEDGRREAQRQAAQSLKELEEALAEAEGAKRRWQAGLRDAAEQFAQASVRQSEAMERLAADVAEVAVRRIVGRLHAERRAVEAACRETLCALHIDAAQVRVSPSDCEAIVQPPPGIELVADAALEPGACLLRSALGDIDAGLATQLSQLRLALTDALREGRT